MNSVFIYLLIGAIIGTFIGYQKYIIRDTPHLRKPDRPFPYQWRELLEKHVAFYNRLSTSQRIEFQKRVHIFLLNVRITGNNTEVTHLDRILVPSGAIIPILGFEKWHYSNLTEVIIYPDKFQIPTTDQFATGLVGWGSMDGTMMLSRKALIEGFDSTSDQKNVAIHKFIHLLDKQDGKIDGVLGKLMHKSDIQHWQRMVTTKTNEINKEQSTIRDYASSNTAEFLAVVSEFYFEEPDKLKLEHPDLFMALDHFYNPPKTKSNYSILKNVGRYNKSER